MTYPSCHGGGGHSFAHPKTANDHFHQWGMTPVEPTEKDNEPIRVSSELPGGDYHSNCGANHNISVFWHPHSAALYWLDRCDFYRDLYFTILSASPFLRVVKG